MNRGVLSVLAVLAALVCLSWMRTLRGQSSETADAAAGFQGTMEPFLSQHCLACHNENLKSGNLNLATYLLGSAAVEHPEVWDRVLGMVSQGKMPPAGMPAPSETERGAVTNWIETFLNRVGFERHADPGRVMARRLNRVEYNNTIRDLLGVSARPADEFPVDDSGYGFDNIADVLTISPMLMEKYLAAANKVSRLAVYGETFPEKPTRLARLLNRRSPDVNDIVSSSASNFPYSLRGAMYGTWVFPVDAEYEFRLRIANFRSEEDRLTPEELERRAAERSRRLAELRRQREAGVPRQRRQITPEERQAQLEAAREAAPPRKLVLALDGEPIFTTVVEGSTTFEYDRGEYIARVPVKAGEHRFRASYPELADLDDPRENINPDLRRALFVDYLEIVGPFRPSTEPPESYRRIFICGHAKGTHQPACARPILENLMRRAYRRPATPEEVDAKLRLVAMVQEEGDPFEEGIRLALEAILASPDFLLKVEREPGTGAKQSGAAYTIDDHELASRLSYFLWASMPDDELFRAAGERNLRDPEVLAAQVRRMMADPKASNLVENFAAQWLQLRNLGRTKPDPARFPTLDDELLDAMRRETNLFVEAIIREDRSILDLIDAPFTYLNGPLARHYGIRGVSGEEFQRVTLDGEQRSGLLTQGSVLTVSSYPTRTSIPVRGKWVLENLLGAPPPPPPDTVPELSESAQGENISLRERLEQHRADPACSSCHNIMDPIGFGLENYDAVGAWRTSDGNLPIDASGVLPDGRSFSGAKDLKQILKSQSEAFTRNLTEKLLTYALGRGLERTDAPTVEHIVSRTTANDYRFSTLVMEIVNSEPFQMRGATGEKP